MARRRQLSDDLIAVTEDGREVLRCVRSTPEYPEPGRRILARWDIGAVYYYCKFCKMEHAVDWDALFAERLRLEAEGGSGKRGGET